MPRMIAVLCLLCLCLPVYAQALKFESFPGSKDLQLAYDRFRDESVLATKPDTLPVRTEKGSLLDPGRGSFFGTITAAVLFSGKELPKQPGKILLIVSPRASGAGGFSDRLSHGSRRQLYFSPDADLIFLVDGQRVAIGRGEKPGGFTSSGDYNDSVFFILTHEQIGQIAAAQKVEAVIGQAELTIKTSLQKRLLALHQALK